MLYTDEPKRSNRKSASHERAIEEKTKEKKYRLIGKSDGVILVIPDNQKQSDTIWTTRSFSKDEANLWAHTLKNQQDIISFQMILESLKK